MHSKIRTTLTLRALHALLGLTLCALAAAVLLAFSVVGHAAQPFDDQSFKQAQAAGKTILVDVAAPWCPTCRRQRQPACAHRRARCNRRPSVGRSTSAIRDRRPIRVGHAARSDLVAVLGSDTGRGDGARCSERNAGRAAMVMAMFGLGAATPILALAYGSRQAIVARRDLLARSSQIAKPLMGAALVGRSSKPP